jgi:hypothetical protein
MWYGSGISQNGLESGPVFPPRCKRPKILPEHGCFQDQQDATSPGKVNTTVMKRLHDWHKSQIIRNICSAGS